MDQHDPEPVSGSVSQERRHAIPEVLLLKPHALAVWVHFRKHPHADLKEVAAETGMSVRYAYAQERWLITHGLLVHIRYGNGKDVLEQRLVIHPASGTDRRAIYRPCDVEPPKLRKRRR